MSRLLSAYLGFALAVWLLALWAYLMGDGPAASALVGIPVGTALGGGLIALVDWENRHE